MQQVIDIVMPASIALIMFGIGLELCFKDFRRVFLMPAGVITGLAGQLLLLPALALLLVLFWPMDDPYKIGLLLLAACPGGTASNLVTKMLGGRVALSVSLTAFNSFFVLLSIPLIVRLGYSLFGNDGVEIDLSFTQTFTDVFTTVALPVLAGILINEYFGDKIGSWLHKFLKIALPLIMLLAFLVVIFLDESQRKVRYLEHLNLLIPLLIFNLISLFAGYALARKLSLKENTSYTIAIELGLQNSVLALFIANQMLEDKDISLVPVLYSSFSLISTFVIGWGLKNYGKRKIEASEEN
ncbi:bile acid:sodium symporter family protein [Salegentibacter sp. HM20]